MRRQHSETLLSHESKDCCPRDAIGSVPQDLTYTPRGTWEVWKPRETSSNEKDVRCYVVRGAKCDEENKFVLVAHDIFGPHSGRTVEICDEIANSLGNVTVVLPDFFRGRPFFDSRIAPPLPGPSNTLSAWCAWFGRACCLCGLCKMICSILCDSQRSAWDKNVAHMFENVIVPTMERRAGKDAPRLAILGFCWGGWFAFHASAYPHIVVCAASCHPSLDVCKMVGERAEDVCDAVAVPQLVLAARQDKPDVKKFGMLDKSITRRDRALRGECKFVEYKEMKHGWVNRGDLNDSDTSRCVRSALSRVKAFFQRYLLEDTGDEDTNRMTGKLAPQPGAADSK